MNREVYKHLLRTYAARPGYWVGFFGEVIRSLLLRVWVAIIMAQIAVQLTEGNIAGAKQSAFYFLIIYAAGSIIGTIGDLVAHRSENKQYRPMSVVYYQKLTGKDMAFYRDNQAGYLTSLLKQYVDSMMLLGRFVRVDMVKMVVSLVIPVIVLLTLHWRLGLVTLGIIVVQMAYVVWSSSKANPYRRLTHELYRKVTGEVSDAITNITAFKSSGAQKQASSRLAELSQQESRAFWLRRRTTILLDLPRDLITALGITTAFLVVLSEASNSSAAVGLIVLTLTYMFQIVRSVSDLPSLMTQHDDLITKAYPTFQYLTQNYERIKDSKRPKKLTIRKGTITVENVSFNYASSATEGELRDIFHNLTLTIDGGERVGIVGLSGAGKSTLANLLMRFDDVTEGAIKIDGIDIRQVRQDELHRNIAYVPQEPLLFHRTIRENIAYFKDRTTDKDIIRAAKAAHAHEFISRLPEGYDSMVGERGVKLSGGQKQRVVIARAILKNAPVMIFDEATSALDTESEKIIQEALPTIIGKHTAIVIAHRLSTVAGLDRIMVMDEGRIVEAGTHHELLKAQGRYYQLWQKQLAD